MILYNDGTGKFIKSYELEDVEVLTYDIKLCDIDNDGYVDIVTSHKYLWYNQGNGNFFKSDYLPVINTGNPDSKIDTQSIAIGDINGGEWCQLSSCSDNYTVGITRIIISTRTDFLFFKSDYLLDGYIDIVFANIDDLSYAIFSKGDGSFGAAVELPIIGVRLQSSHVELGGEKLLVF